MNFKSLLMVSFAMVALFGCSPENKIRDFDMVCGYFGELNAVRNLADMNYEQRNEFIMERIMANLSERSNARVGWEAISSAQSDQRYELFKSAADSIQNGDWHCEPMKELAASTGWFE